MHDKQTKNTVLSDVWLKAAVVGGLWASVEIIIGSFLHNLRIPFAGSILASFGTIFLVAFFQLWPVKGLIWRAGIICALMKSLSPSSVIFGPMIGIMLEAFLLEGVIRIFGKNLFAFLLGGSFSVLSALLHKIVGLLILYGFNLIQIYLNIFYFAAKQIHIQNVDAWVLVDLLIGIYVVIGSLAALTGFFIGRKSRLLQKENRELSLTDISNRELFNLNSEQQFRLVFLLIHLLIIPAGLTVLNFFNFYIGTALVALYAGFCIYYYRNILRRLKKPIFWIQLIIVALLAGFFWKNGNFTGGLIIGLEMNVRAILIVLSFSALSVELRNPLVKTFLFRKGFRNIYIAVSMAFSILPVMIGNIPKSKEMIGHPVKSIAGIICNAGGWLEMMKPQNKEI